MHSAIDKHPILRPLSAPTITEHEYARALACLHPLYDVTEPALGKFIMVGCSEFSFKHRNEALSYDLVKLERDPFPDFGHIWDALPNSQDETIGALYMLEGSRLGGSFICNHLQATCAGLPTKFFADQGTDPYATWAAFHQILDLEQHAIDHAKCVIGAIRLFNAFLKHLNICLEFDLAVPLVRKKIAW